MLGANEREWSGGRPPPPPPSRRRRRFIRGPQVKRRKETQSYVTGWTEGANKLVGT